MTSSPLPCHIFCSNKLPFSIVSLCVWSFIFEVLIFCLVPSWMCFKTITPNIVFVSIALTQRTSKFMQSTWTRFASKYSVKHWTEKKKTQNKQWVLKTNYTAIKNVFRRWQPSQWLFAYTPQNDSIFQVEITLTRSGNGTNITNEIANRVIGMYCDYGVYRCEWKRPQHSFESNRDWLKYPIFEFSMEKLHF